MKHNLYRWRAASATVLIAGAAFGATLTGCGGGGGGNPVTRVSAPTEATRARVQSLLGQSAQSGAYFSGGGGVAAGGSASAPGAEDGSSTGSVENHPYLGVFFQRSALHNAVSGRAVSRQADGADFYFDEFLGLWTAFSSTPGKTAYTLYEDEARTMPAGFITTEMPADYETFPQIYRSSYQFTSGYLKGSRGFSNDTVQADYSGSSEYENLYADGGKSKGMSRFNGSGNSTYKSRDDMADGSWSESVGTFRDDGSGGTRFTTSDGYGAEYTFNADGTGRGKITGREPGLPATIVWDARGTTTITYADGTVERFGYGFGYGSGYGDEIIEEPIPEPAATTPLPKN